MVLVFGATGFSGRMVVKQLVARGLPVRAGARSEEKLNALAERFPRIETAVCDVADPASVIDASAGCSLLITTVGPYSEHGEPALLAALEAGIPYIDIAGEPAWLAKVFGEFDAAARERGTTLLPAIGYDYVPGNLAGALLLERLGERAVQIDIGYCLAGENKRSTESFSQGTLDSLKASSGFKPFAFRGGELISVEGSRRKQTFELSGHEEVSTVAIGGSEHFTLPRLAPWLAEVNVGLGWFTPGQQTEQPEQPSGSREGPSDEHRARARARIVVEARDASAELIGRADVDGPNPYDMSGLLCAWAAQQLADGLQLPAGALGPVEAFGLRRLEAGCAEIGLTVELS